MLDHWYETEQPLETERTDWSHREIGNDISCNNFWFPAWPWYRFFPFPGSRFSLYRDANAEVMRGVDDLSQSFTLKFQIIELQRSRVHFVVAQ